MGTFLSIQNRVKARLIDLPSAVLAEVPQLVVEAVRHLEKEHNFKVMETGLYGQATTALTRTVASLPANFKEWRSKPYYRTALGTQRELVWAADTSAPNLAYNDTDQGQPELVVDGEPNDAGISPIQVWPLPDGLSDYGDGEYRLYLPYYRYLPDLAADADTNWFTVNAEEYLINQAVGQGFMLDWDEQRSSLWQAQMQKLLGEVKKLDKARAMSGVNTWVPHWQGARTPNLRF